MPMPVLMMMTNPKTASFHDPAMSTMTMAVRMMPLNSVNTFARTMSASERDVDDVTAFVCPRSMRSSTCAAVNPRSDTSGIFGCTVVAAFVVLLMRASLLDRVHPPLYAPPASGCAHFVKTATVSTWLETST